MIITPSHTITRPADTNAYTAGDLIANSTTAGSVVPMRFGVSGLANAGRGLVKAARLLKSATTTTDAQFRVWLFTASPTVTNGDNGALAVATAATIMRALAIDMQTTALAMGGGHLQYAAFSPEVCFDLGSETRAIYGLLEATDGYVPASAETFTVTLEIASA